MTRFWRFIFVVYALLTVNVSNAKYINYDFVVTSTIDKSNMLSETVELKLVPNSITLTYDPALNTFSNKNVDLVIVSNIYTFDSQINVKGYELFLLENTSSCYSSVNKGAETVMPDYADIANIYLDNATDEMVVNKGYAIDDKDFSDVNVVKEHNLKLVFDSLGESVKSCDGAFVIGFRYDL